MEAYASIEKSDSKEDYSYSILKLGLLTWRKRVFKPNKKSLIKASK
jgi:hypothetical protein